MSAPTIVKIRVPASELAQPHEAKSKPARVRPVTLRRRMAVFTCLVAGAFAAVSGQLLRLGLKGEHGPSLSMARPLARSWARPDIVDRKGRLLATDVAIPSLVADPAIIDDPDLVALELAKHLEGEDPAKLAKKLAQKGRRFVWIKRGLTPKKAQEIHDLGIPGLRFRNELRRIYPAGNTASHVLGTVSVDNLGQLGIERFIDDKVGVEAVNAPGRTTKPPVRLSLDLGAQHALRAELADAMKRYKSAAAAGIVLDVATGEILAASSLPDYDPNHSAESLEKRRIDRLVRERYELGSVFKTLTLAAAIDGNYATTETEFDARLPIKIGRYTINDLHPARRWMTARDIFVQSSNIGSARIADHLGPERLRGFFARLGLLEQMETEIGPLVAPDFPDAWRRIHNMTISYGHGLAVAPLQFAAASAALFNGGKRIYPTFLKVQIDRVRYRPKSVLKQETSGVMRGLMRLNVTSPSGTGRRANVPGYEVGGKTGTADIPGKGGYKGNGVNTSFLAIFPANEPRYLTLVTIFKPKRTAASGNSVTAGRTAAPTTARIIERVAPILGLAPRPLKGEM